MIRIDQGMPAGLVVKGSVEGHETHTDLLLEERHNPTKIFTYLNSFKVFNARGSVVPTASTTNTAPSMLSEHSRAS